MLLPGLSQFLRRVDQEMDVMASRIEVPITLPLKFSSPAQGPKCVHHADSRDCIRLPRSARMTGRSVQLYMHCNVLHATLSDAIVSSTCIHTGSFHSPAGVPRHSGVPAGSTPHITDPAPHCPQRHAAAHGTGRRATVRQYQSSGTCSTVLQLFIMSTHACVV